MIFKIYSIVHIRLFCMTMLLTAAFTACKKKESVPTLFDGGNAVVLGEWKWLETQEFYCSTGYNYLNPENTGDNFSFLLNSDTSVTFIKNGGFVANYPLDFYVFDVDNEGYVEGLKKVYMEMSYMKNEQIQYTRLQGRLNDADFLNFPFKNDSCESRINFFEKVF